MSSKTEPDSGLPTRVLGRTGVEVSLIGLGGWHLGFKYIDEELSNLIQYQNAYSANARVITVVQTLYQTLLKM